MRKEKYRRIVTLFDESKFTHKTILDYLVAYCNDKEVTISRAVRDILEEHLGTKTCHQKKNLIKEQIY
jgi:hypothetical protein